MQIIIGNKQKNINKCLICIYLPLQMRHLLHLDEEDKKTASSNFYFRKGAGFGAPTHR